MSMAKVKTWKPGQLVTISGIVYRIKRSHGSLGPCIKCALRHTDALTHTEGFCAWPDRKQYPIPGNCYLERVSPIMKVFYE